LIEAISIFKKDVSDFICYLVGDGKLQTEIQQRVDQLDLTENIKLLGFQTHERVSELLDRSDILVLPSLSEGIPVAVMEAMASGLPVIATNVTGVPELVEDGVTGLLVPSKNSSALSEAILKLVRSPDLRNRMGAAGRRKVLEEFNMHTAILDLYRLFLNS
jgi:glycosyltransferase involved in cell wall biosynthesis